jgi:hypothetical protein
VRLAHPTKPGKQVAGGGGLQGGGADALRGKKVVAEFLTGLEGLECGTDLITQDACRVPALSR